MLTWVPLEADRTSRSSPGYSHCATEVGDPCALPLTTCASPAPGHHPRECARGPHEPGSAGSVGVKSCGPGTPACLHPTPFCPFCHTE